MVAIARRCPIPVAESQQKLTKNQASLVLSRLGVAHVYSSNTPTQLIARILTVSERVDELLNIAGEHVTTVVSPEHEQAVQTAGSNMANLDLGRWADVTPSTASTIEVASLDSLASIAHVYTNDNEAMNAEQAGRTEEVPAEYADSEQISPNAPPGPCEADDAAAASITAVASQPMIPEVLRDAFAVSILDERYRTIQDIELALRRLCANPKLNQTRAESLEYLSRLYVKQHTDAKFAAESLSFEWRPRKPESIKFHGQYFNAVDRLDLMLSFLRSGDKTKHVGIAILRYIAEVAVVQSHSLCSEIEWANFDGVDLKEWFSAENISPVGRMRSQLQCSITEHLRELQTEQKASETANGPEQGRGNKRSRSTSGNSEAQKRRA